MALSEETIDGLMLEMRLAANPKVRASREAYFAALRVDRGTLATLERVRLEAAATEMRLITLPGAVTKIELSDLIDRIARCMRSKERPRWLEALGLQDPDV